METIVNLTPGKLVEEFLPNCEGKWKDHMHFEHDCEYDDLEFTGLREEDDLDFIQIHFQESLQIFVDSICKIQRKNCATNVVEWDIRKEILNAPQPSVDTFFIGRKPIKMATCKK